MGLKVIVYGEKVIVYGETSENLSPASLQLRQKLHNPRVYAKLNLRLQNQFTSKYALVLWEVCFDYFDTDRDQGETPFIPLETFRELMGIEVSEYQTFKALNRDVIKPAIKEINALTNYHVEVEYKRIRRSVAELKFRIVRVKQLPVQESVFPDIEDLPPSPLNSSKPKLSGKSHARSLKKRGNLSPLKISPNPGRTLTSLPTSQKRLRCRSLRQMSQIVPVIS